MSYFFTAKFIESSKMRNTQSCHRSGLSAHFLFTTTQTSMRSDFPTMEKQVIKHFHSHNLTRLLDSGCVERICGGCHLARGGPVHNEIGSPPAMKPQELTSRLDFPHQQIQLHIFHNSRQPVSLPGKETWQPVRWLNSHIRKKSHQRCDPYTRRRRHRCGHFLHCGKADD